MSGDSDSVPTGIVPLTQLRSLGLTRMRRDATLMPSFSRALASGLKRSPRGHAAFVPGILGALAALFEGATRGVAAFGCDVVLGEVSMRVRGGLIGEACSVAYLLVRVHAGEATVVRRLSALAADLSDLLVRAVGEVGWVSGGVSRHGCCGGWVGCSTRICRMREGIVLTNWSVFRCLSVLVCFLLLPFHPSSSLSPLSSPFPLR